MAEATPITKRIGVICITVINVACIVGVCLGEITFDAYKDFMTPSLVGLCALIDGGK